VIASNGSTFEMIYHHFHERLGVPMPNVSALLPHVRPLKCWDHMCWCAKRTKRFCCAD
jgi:hypothetical protein